jgi:hypothetical protein
MVGLVAMMKAERKGARMELPNLAAMHDQEDETYLLLALADAFRAGEQGRHAYGRRLLVTLMDHAQRAGWTGAPWAKAWQDRYAAALVRYDAQFPRVSDIPHGI